MTLYRFEDSYGMFDLWCMSRGINRKCIGAVQSKSLCNFYSDDYVCFGLSSSQVCYMTEREMVMLSHKFQNGGCIVAVLDLDDATGDNQKILSVSDFLYGSKGSVSGAMAFNKLAEKYGFSVKFAFVSYCAETIALYEHATVGSRMTDIVCMEGGKLLHEALNSMFVKKYIDCNRELFGENVKVSRMAKRMHQYVNLHKLIEVIANCDDPMNMGITKWVAGGMKDCTYLLSVEEAAQYLGEINNRYYELMGSEKSEFVLYGQRFKCGDKALNEIMQDVKAFLSKKWNIQL